MNFDGIIAERPGKTVYRSGEYAVKVFDSDYSKADVLSEALNQARVEETKIYIPRLVEVSKIDGKWALTMDYIEGRTLEELMRANPERTEDYLSLFVNIQMEIHACRAPRLNRMKDKMRRKISETDLDATTKYDLQTRLEGMKKHDKVCHGDFCPGNVIVSGSGVPYVIDWSHATRGNASTDAARTYLLFCLHDQKELAERYITMFCRKSDIAKQYVWQWLPIVAASQSAKNRPEEREFLAKWINVMDYE